MRARPLSFIPILGVCLALAIFCTGGEPVRKRSAPRPPEVASTELQVLVWIDGRDELKLFPTHALWSHLENVSPLELELNGVKWDLRKQAQLENKGPTQYSKLVKRFGAAELIKHKGRGQVQLAQDQDGNLAVQFNDPQSGADIYQVTIKFTPHVPDGNAGHPGQGMAVSLLPPRSVRLADGTDFLSQDYGETYWGYEFREPCRVDRRDGVPLAKDVTQVRSVVSYADHPGKLGENLRPRSLLLDCAHQKLYWLDTLLSHKAGHLRRANFDGSQIETLVSDLVDPRSLALDLKHQKIYWMVAGSRSIRRSNLDGTQIEDVVVGLNDLGGLAVDPERDALFFSDKLGSDKSSQGRIYRSRLDGSDRRLLVENHCAWQMVLDPAAQKLYWCEYDKSPFRCDVDGSNVEPVVRLESGMGGSVGFDIDPKNGKIYYSTADSIRRANLDGTQIEDIAIATGSESEIGALGIDLQAQQIYWLEIFSAKGSGVVVTRIRQVPIPPPLMQKENPAPPLIEKIVPARQRVQGKIEIKGKHLDGVKRIVFAGIGTGDCAEASFVQKSRESVELTVPAMVTPCEEAAIIVFGPGGVTVTLPTAPLTVTAKHEGDRLEFDPWQAKQTFVAVVNPRGRMTGLERCLCFVSESGRVSQGRGGKNILFLKNGATTSVRFPTNCQVYFEPFALINHRGSVPDSTKLIPVPAIRASFVSRLFRFQ